MVKTAILVSGGGFYENVPRMLPDGARAMIDTKSFPVPPVFTLLQERGIANQGTKLPVKEPYRFYVSDLADKFKHFANSILPYDIETTIKINIEEY